MDGDGDNCIPDSHLHRVTYARCHIDTLDSPDDGHMVARNMQSIEISIYGKEMCVRLVIYKNYTKMHGQQNIKLGYLCLCVPHFNF